MNKFHRFIRIYTPFIITTFTFANAIVLLVSDETIMQYVFAALSGNSTLVTIYMYCMSLRMCIWYKINLLCLLLTQLLGLLYNLFDIKDAVYIWAIILLCSLGIICFLIFRRFYEVK